MLTGIADLVAFSATALLLFPFVRFARRAMLDRPSARSSHAMPTPRGGGAVLVVVYLVVCGVCLPAVSHAFMWAAAAIGLVAVVGWMDDRSSLSPRLRLVVHVVAGGMLVPFASAYPYAALPAPVWAAGIVAWTVSAINVVNFMDGIDGLIASQMALFAGHIYLISPAGAAGVQALTLAGACIGFLIWNWPPARVFLGDVGSGALGVIYVIGGILATEHVHPVYAFLPLYPLFLDALVTLVRRAGRGERLSEPHRSHLYQRLANGSWGHRRVTVLYFVVSAGGAVIVWTPDALRAALAVGYALFVVLLGSRLEPR